MYAYMTRNFVITLITVATVTQGTGIRHGLNEFKSLRHLLPSQQQEQIENVPE
jgi:hypothetical protein